MKRGRALIVAALAAAALAGVVAFGTRETRPIRQGESPSGAVSEGEAARLSGRRVPEAPTTDSGAVRLEALRVRVVSEDSSEAGAPVEVTIAAPGVGVVARASATIGGEDAVLAALPVGPAYEAWGRTSRSVGWASQSPAGETVLAMEATQAVRVSNVTPDGDPVEGVEVSLRREGSLDDAGDAAQMGGKLVGVDPRRDYLAFVSGAGLSAPFVRVPASAPARSAHLDVGPAPRLRVRLAGGGVPAREAEVTVDYPEQGVGYGSGWHSLARPGLRFLGEEEVASLADGLLEIPDLPPGRVRVRVLAHDREVAKEAELEAGKTTELDLR